MISSKPRKGVSTILGTLIFIGILFTSVIPMMLVMKQADTIYTQTDLERKRLDEERDREDIEVYPIPSLTQPEMNITLKNTGDVPAQAVRLWINNTYYNVTASILAFGSVDIGPFPAATNEGVEYEVRVSTARGNMFLSEIGTIRYEGGQWLSETLGFNLIFPSRPGKAGRGNNWLNELRITIEQDGDEMYSNSTMYWAISASEKFFMLDTADTYDIIIYIWCSGAPKHWEKIYDTPHSITWPEGDPIVELNFVINGDQLGLE